MAGPGIGAMVLGSSSDGQSLDVGKELRETLGKVKQVADAATVGTLIRSVVGTDEQGPSKDEADAAGKTIGIAKDLTAMQTEKEKSAREEAEYWRQRAIEAEEVAKSKKAESRQEELGAMGAMANMFMAMMAESRQNQTEMTKLLLETVRDKREEPADPVKDGLAQLGMQFLQGRAQADPVDQLKGAIETLKAVGIPVGHDAQSAGAIDLGAYRVKKELDLMEKRLDIEAQRAARELDREDKKADAEAHAKLQQAKALEEGFSAFAAAVGKRGDKGEASAQTSPQQASLKRYACSECGTVTATGRTDKFMCSNPECGQVVYIAPPPPQNEADANE